MIAIHQEAQEVAQGAQPKDNNVLKHAPHPYSAIALDEKEWDRLVRFSGVEHITEYE